MAAITPTCFARGTFITTQKSDVAIEDLAPGDQVLTATSGWQPVRWIGQRTVDLAAWPDSATRHVQPILIAAGALGEQFPNRDLVISACHSVVIGNTYIPAGNMVNGVSITTLPNLDSVTYYHVEFDHPEVVFANGLPAESFVDVGNRHAFDSAVGTPAAPPRARARPEHAARAPSSCRLTPLESESTRTFDVKDSVYDEFCDHHGPLAAVAG